MTTPPPDHKKNEWAECKGPDHSPLIRLLAEVLNLLSYFPFSTCDMVHNPRIESRALISVALEPRRPHLL